MPKPIEFGFLRDLESKTWGAAHAAGDPVAVSRSAYVADLNSERSSALHAAWQAAWRDSFNRASREQAEIAFRLANLNGHGWTSMAYEGHPCHGVDASDPRNWGKIFDAMETSDRDEGLRPPPVVGGKMIHRTCGSTLWIITDYDVQVWREGTTGSLTVTMDGHVKTVPAFPAGDEGEAARSRTASYLVAIRGDETREGYDRAYLALSPLCGD